MIDDLTREVNPDDRRRQWIRGGDDWRDANGVAVLLKPDVGFPEHQVPPGSIVWADLRPDCAPRPEQLVLVELPVGGLVCELADAPSESKLIGPIAWVNPPSWTPLDDDDLAVFGLSADEIARTPRVPAPTGGP